MSEVYDSRPCRLGEGPLWHPERRQLFWFDILNGRLLARRGDEVLEWQFDEMVSAAGWIDRSHLLIASESELFTFDPDTGATAHVVPLEADDFATRSNDGRADPWGGFWIGTMGKHAEPGAGAIYRFYKGQIRRIYAQLTIPNAICFAPDRNCAYFTDTVTKQVMTQPLGQDGWPEGTPELFLDLAPEGRNPDGAVTDAAGNLWLAQWGAGRVACYSPAGILLRIVQVGARQSSCPAFGGRELKSLFVTTASEGIDETALVGDPGAGKLFVTAPGARGLPEPRVRL